MQHVHTRHRTAMLGRRFFQDLHLPVSVTAPTPAPAEGYRDKVAAAAVAAAAAAAPAAALVCGVGLTRAQGASDSKFEIVTVNFKF
jgi:hypothetical protein